jgi:hypothetical protein
MWRKPRRIRLKSQRTMPLSRMRSWLAWKEKSSHLWLMTECIIFWNRLYHRTMGRTTKRKSTTTCDWITSRTNRKTKYSTSQRPSASFTSLILSRLRRGWDARRKPRWRAPSFRATRSPPRRRTRRGCRGAKALSSVRQCRHERTLYRNKTHTSTSRMSPTLIRRSLSRVPQPMSTRLLMIVVSKKTKTNNNPD